MQAIQGAGYTESQFMEEVRQDMTRDQLTQAVESDFVIARLCPGAVPLHQ